MSHPAALAFAWRMWSWDPGNRNRVIALENAARANVPEMGPSVSAVRQRVAERLRDGVPLHEAVRP